MPFVPMSPGWLQLAAVTLSEPFATQPYFWCGIGILIALIAVLSWRIRVLVCRLRHLASTVDEQTRDLRLQIRQRERAEDEARRNEMRYRALFNNSPQPLWVYDRKRGFVDVNEAAVRRYGYSKDEFRTLTADVLVAPDDSNRSGDLLRRSTKHCTKSGEIIEVEVTTQPFLYDGRPAELVLAQDVTERRRLEEQLQHAQKMETIGQLAGGVAHDFNNLLTTILGFGELALDATSADDPSRHFLEEITKAGARAAALTRQLLAFGRKQLLHLIELDVNHVIGELQPMLRRLISENIRLTTNLGADLWRVKADKTQIEQVIVNLAVNARDAMPAGGTLRISTRNEVLDEAQARVFAETRPGRYVALVVEDNGTGMPPDVLARIFEPFFTTKGVGKGTGLGLAQVYGVIKQCHGHIDVTSEEGHGSRFTVYLPAVGARTTAPDTPSIAPPVENSGSNRSHTILLAEDEVDVRRLAALSLKQQGYRVLEAADGREALEVSRQHKGPIDVLLTDVVMPEIGGLELAHALTAERSGLKVVFVSGYADHAVVPVRELKRLGRLLMKPFTPVTLQRAVEDAILGKLSDSNPDSSFMFLESPESLLAAPAWQS